MAITPTTITLQETLSAVDQAARYRYALEITIPSLHPANHYSNSCNPSADAESTIPTAQISSLGLVTITKTLTNDLSRNLPATFSFENNRNCPHCINIRSRSFTDRHHHLPCLYQRSQPAESSTATAKRTPPKNIQRATNDCYREKRD